MKGGGKITEGIDIKNIAAFNPSTIPGLVLWIKADPTSFKYEEISAYAQEQLPSIRLHLLQTFGSTLHNKVITEITSDTPNAPNGLIRMEFQTKLSTRFPTFVSGAIDLSNYVDPDTGLERTLTLVTKTPLNLPTNFSFFETSQGLSLKYFDSIDNLTITASQMITSPTTTLDATGESHIVPTATLKELLVFSRKLSTQEQQQIEGYLAYKNNRQYNLSNNHPYLPDMTSEQSVSGIINQLNTIENTIKATLLKQESLIKEYLAKIGADDLTHQAPDIRQILVNSLSYIPELKSILSRGALYTRSTTGITDINSIYDGINAINVYTIPMSATQMKSEIANLTANLNMGIDYVKKLSNTNNKIIQNNISTNQIIIANSQKDAETEEGLHLIQYQVRRREFVESKRFIQKEVSELGQRLLEVFYTEFSSQLDNLEQAFNYNIIARKKSLDKIMTTFTGIQASITSRAWVQEFSHFTTTEYDSATSKYKDPTIQQLHSKFLAIEDEIQNGDIKYLTHILELMSKQAITIIGLWKPKRKYALLPHLYIVHLQELFYNAERLEQDLTDAIEKITNILRAFSDELVYFKQYQTVIIADPGLGVRYYLPLQTIYFSRLLSADSAILNFTHILTDEMGQILKTANASGDLDLQFFQPEMQGWTAHPTEKETYIRETPYKDLSGNPVNQIFKMTPHMDKSILKDLPTSRLKPIHQKTLDGSFFELPRYLISNIIQIQTSTIQEPVFLPKYSVRTKSFYFIQNVGKVHLCIRNPGAIDDVIDCLGPGEIGIYLYGEGTSLSSTPGFAYGKVEWIEYMLPYDTITDCPRSSVATFVPELNKLIYVMPESHHVPLLDKDGYYIEAQKASDGNVYDPDDFSRSNPYTIKVLPDTALALLEPGPQARVRPITNEIGVARELTTGLGILCSAEGIPAVDEFGTCKIAATHLLYMTDTVKIKGATDDLIVKGFIKDKMVRQLYQFETGLNFDELFRSRFCTPMKNGTATSPIFVTSHRLPLCGPLGTFIFLPGTAKQQQSLLTYIDTNGIKQAFLIEEENPVPQGIAEQIPYINLAETIPQMLGVLKAKHILYRYASSIEYIESIIKKMDTASHDISILGTTIVSPFQSNVAQTKVLIQKSLDGFSELQDTIRGVKTAVDNNMIPNDLQISIGVLDIKIRDKLHDINNLYNPIEESFEFYKGLVQKITDLSGFIIRLKKDATDIFSMGYEAIRTIDGVNIRENKTLSSPEIDAIKLLLKEKNDEFGAAQTELQTRIAEQPEFIGDIRDWILDLQVETAKQFNRLEAVKRLVVIRLAHDIANAEGKDLRDARNDLQALNSDLQLQKQEFGKYVDLFNTCSTAPTPQDPIKAPNQQGPFIYLVNPCVDRDLRPLAAIVTKDDLKQAWTTLLADFDKLKGDLNIAQAGLVTSLVIPNASATKEVLISAVNDGKKVVDGHAKIIADFKASCVGPFQKFSDLMKETLQNYKETLTAKLELMNTEANKIGDQRLALETMLKAKPNDSVQAQIDAVGSEEASDIIFKMHKIVDPILANTTPSVFFPLQPIDIDSHIKRLQDFQTSLPSISVSV